MILRLYLLGIRSLLAQLLSRAPGRRSRAPKFIAAGLFVAYVAGSLMLAMWLLFTLLLGVLTATGDTWLYFAVFAVISFGLGAFGTVFVTTGHIFGARDNEALLALPIRPWHILASRLLVLLTIECLLSLPIFVPVAAVWLDGGPATAVGTVFLFAGLILVPVMTLSLALILAWLLSAVLGRVRRFANLVFMAVAVSFLAAYLALIANLQDYIVGLVGMGAEVAAVVSRTLPPFYAFGVAVADADPARFAAFVAWSLLPFAALVVVLGRRYRRILTATRGTRRVEYRPRPARLSGLDRALLARELTQYLSRPMVVLNATIGSVMALVGAGALLVRGGAVLPVLDARLPGLDAAVMAAVGLVLVGATNTLSSSLVSLEGETVWIVRSLPVSAAAALRAKVRTHLVVSSGPFLVASAITASVLAGDVGDWLLILAVPQAFLVFAAYAGLAVNLWLPRLDWINEMQVVRQSAASLVALFGGFGVVATFGAVYLALGHRVMSPAAYLWASAAVCLAGAAVVRRHLAVGGARRFEGLPA